MYFIILFFFFKRMGHVRFHEGCPCPGQQYRTPKRGSGPKSGLSPLARVQGSAPKDGQRMGMPQSTLAVSCGMALPCLRDWFWVHFSIAHVHITPCLIIH